MEILSHMFSVFAVHTIIFVILVLSDQNENKGFQSIRPDHPRDYNEVHCFLHS